MERKGTGLVFAGGGGKGGYEIGVWKYLHEIGLDKHICAVSGTSVGALNAALFVGGSFEKAEELWSNINQSQILTPKKIEEQDVIDWLSDHNIKLSNKIAGSIATFVEDVQELAVKLTECYYTYLFSRKGLEMLIKNGINIKQLQNSNVECFTTCCRLSDSSVERFKLNEYSYDEVKTLLLASSAIPVIFKPERFKKKMYRDGGFPTGDNAPVKPLYDLGVAYIIVVHLDGDEFIDRSLYPDAKIIEIAPSEYLGGIVKGALDFTAEGAKKRMVLGYRDAKKAISPLVKMLQLTQERKIIYGDFIRSMESFNEKKMKHDEKVRQRKEEEKNDGFEEVMKELGI